MVSFSTTFRAFTIQPEVSRSVWIKGSNYVIKLSKRFQALSHYLLTPNFKIEFLPWWEKDWRTNRRKLRQNWPPTKWDITMNSQVICVFIFSKLFFQPNILELPPNCTFYRHIDMCRRFYQRHILYALKMGRIMQRVIMLENHLKKNN